MQKFNGSLIRQFPSQITGNAASGVQVTVKITGSNTLATLYATNNMAGATKSNPATTDTKGFYSFYAADGQYVLEFSNGFPSLDVQLVDVDAIRNDFDTISGEFDALDVSNATFKSEQQAAYDAFVLSQGWDQVGTFAVGFEFNSPNQVGQDDDGNWWRSIVIPKTVDPATDPTSDSDYKLVGDGVLRNDLAAPDSTVLVGGKSAKDIGAGLFGRVNLLLGNGTNLLIRDEAANQATRVHIEPNGYVDNGTTAKLDLMFDPYQDNNTDYRILNLYTVTGDPFGTGEGAICAINAKGVGNTWGLWPSIQLGFQDLGTDAVCAKLWYGDHAQAEHFTPNKGNWRTGKSFSVGDYATNDNKVYKAETAGSAGATAPTHIAGTESDGAISWEFINAPNFNNVRATFMFGDRSDMPILGYKDARSQFIRTALIGWNAEFQWLDNDENLLFNMRKDATGGGATKWMRFQTAGTGYERWHQNANYKQRIGLAYAANVVTATDNATSFAVSGIETVRFNNTSATTVSNLTGGVGGQRIRLVSANANTTIKHEGVLSSGGVIKNASTANILMNVSGALDLERDVSADFWRVVGVGY